MLRIAIAVAALLPPIVHADVTVGSGSTVHFADATLDVGCGDLNVNGSVDAGAATLSKLADFSLAGGAFALGKGTLSLGGDFSNDGTFAPDTGTVIIGDICGSATSTFRGANAFYALSIATSAGKQVIFPVGRAQSVAHTLSLHGAPAHLLRIASGVAGQQGVLAVAAGATQTVAYVDARDNLASVMPIAPGAPSLYQSIDGGDLTHWFDVSGGSGSPGGGVVPTPALGRLALLLLAALLAAFGGYRCLTRTGQRITP
jgi:hypothetical protein